MDGGYDPRVPFRVPQSVSRPAVIAKAHSARYWPEAIPRPFAYTFPNDSEGQGSAEMNKRDLNERDICSKFITPAILSAGWDLTTQIREEVRFTKGRIIVRGKLVAQ